MTFENLAKLTHAKLVNEPAITSFDAIVFEPEKVKMGDLFIGRDPEQVKKALARGAYAILSDRKIPVYDEEVGWLRCENIESALVSLLRYYLSQKTLTFVCFDPVSVALMQKVAHRENLLFLADNIETNFHRLMDADPGSIVVGSDENFIRQVYPAYTIIEPPVENSISVFKSTLLQSSFYYREHLYENIKVPELFLPQLAKILDFLQTHAIPFDVYKCDYTPWFYPLFVTKRLQLKPFGTTPLTLIITKDAAMLPDVANYVREKASWAKLLCIYPHKVDTAHCPISATLRYHSIEEIEKLKEIEFNFAIINADPQKVVQTIKNLTKKEPQSLFEEL